MSSRTKRTELFFFIFFFSVAIFFAAPFRYARAQKSQNAGQYQKLIQLYFECMELEDANFSKLSFRLAEEQLVKTGSGVKLTLVDDLGRFWIFKRIPAEQNREFRTAAAYRIFRLFGLNSPETHVYALTLNGKREKGTIQRYLDAVPDSGVFTQHKLAPDAVNFLLKAQTLNWLFRGYDTTFEHFIILSLSGENEVAELRQVDLDSLLSEEGEAYDYDYMISFPALSWLKKERTAFYWLLEEYKAGNIEVDWKGNYPFVEFVSDLPDDFFKLLILPAKNHNLRIPKDQRITPDMFKGSESFLESYVKMKKTLREDFGKFYERVVKISGDGGSGWGYGTENDEIARAISNLARRKQELMSEQSGLKRKAALPAEIEARISVEGYDIAYQVRSTYPFGKEGREAEFDRAWKRLSELENNAANEAEKEAIKYYKQQMRKIRKTVWGAPAELCPTAIDSSLIEEQR